MASTHGFARHLCRQPDPTRPGGSRPSFIAAMSTALEARSLSRLNSHTTGRHIGIASFVSIYQLLGASLLAGFLTQRIRLEDFKSWQHLRQISLPRLYLVLLFFTAWLYFVITGLVLQGIGLDLDDLLCTIGVYLCVSLYGTAKLFVYMFLTERAYVVWCPTLSLPRYKSPVYLTCLVAVILYTGVVCHLYIVRIAHLRDDGICMIGFRLDGVIVLVVFDVIVSILMTGLFIWPLARTRFHSQQLRHIARRSVTAAAIVLGTSCVNITVLAALDGQERGWICLASWEGDVLIGSIALFWLTSGSGLRPISSVLHARSFRSSITTTTTAPSPTVAKGRGPRWLHKVPSWFEPRPTALRHSSLPTIMTHGMLESERPSRVPSVELPPPSPAVTHGELPWSSLEVGVPAFEDEGSEKPREPEELRAVDFVYEEVK